MELSIYIWEGRQEGGFELIDVLSCNPWLNNIIKNYVHYFDAEARGFNPFFEKNGKMHMPSCPNSVASQA
jgi:hypothetical protein